MASLQIPLKSGASFANYNFSVQLGDNLVDFTQLYRTLTGKWSLSASIDGVPIFSGVMLLVGVNLVQCFNIGDSFGALYLTGDDPTLDSLGVSSSLVWVSP